MLETLSVFQWSILALAALCIGMSNLTEPPDASGNRNRSLARNPSGKTLPRKSLPQIYSDKSRPLKNDKKARFNTISILCEY